MSISDGHTDWFVEFPARVMIPRGTLDANKWLHIRRWCEITLEHGSYCLYGGECWFKKEPDAILFRLKWL